MKTIASPAESVNTFNHSEFIIDRILPTGEVHMIAGPSGAGKTTYLFQILRDIQSGGVIFGYQSRPVKFVYIACDRALKALRKTMKRISMAETFPLYSLISSPEFEAPQHRTATGLLARVRELHPDVELVVIDAIGLLIAEGNDYHKAGQFITSMVKCCERHSLTVFGIHHSPKQKRDSGYDNPRSRLSGAASWAGTIETLILIEPTEEANVEIRDRRITLCPRNEPEQVFDFTTAFDGTLEPREIPKKKGDLESEFTTHLLKLPTGDISTAQIRAIFDLVGIKERYGRKLLNKKLNEGVIFKFGKHYSLDPRSVTIQ